ncbi:MAG: DUF167 domain-containing protein [Planctomycetaceae bacterium]|nr:DUF167 domain-containing protein [Planctomycetaceae bacterium]
MTDLHLDETESGILLPVQAQPKARRNAITGIHDGRLKVSVTAAPEKGKANAAIVQLLARELDLSKSSVAVHSGETSSRKKILISGLPATRLEERLTAILREGGSTG